MAIEFSSNNNVFVLAAVNDYMFSIFSIIKIFLINSYDYGHHNFSQNEIFFTDGDSQSLKEHLIDELDYILLPTEGWNKLVSWYTLMEGQEPIARKVW